MRTLDTLIVSPPREPAQGEIPIVSQKTIRLREQAFADALTIFEALPNFPARRVWMVEQMDEVTRTRPLEAQSLATSARLKYVLELFDVRAAAFMDLVADMPLQKTFMVMLQSFSHAAWLEYTGFSLDMLQPVGGEGSDIVQIFTRAQYWTNEGYKHLVALSAVSKVKRAPTTDSGPPADKKRRARLEPRPELLADRETVSKTDAANVLGVSTRQLDRYVRDNLLTPVGRFGRNRFNAKDLISFLKAKKKDK